MAGSYQVPQFLDSGDKIIGPLNIRQFAYVFVGSLISFALYNAFAAFGAIVALFAAAPLAIFVIFLGFGKFNGRDSEIYLFKFLENLRKKNHLTYNKKAQTPELDMRLNKLTFANLNSEMEKSYQTILQNSEKQAEFKNLPIAEKISRIRSLSQGIDVQSKKQFESLYADDIINRSLDENYQLGDFSMYKKIFSFGPKLVTKTEQIQIRKQQKLPQSEETTQNTPA